MGDLERQMSDLIAPRASAVSLADSDIDVAAELQLLVTQVALLKMEMEGELVNTPSTTDSCISITN